MSLREGKLLRARQRAAGRQVPRSAHFVFAPRNSARQAGVGRSISLPNSYFVFPYFPNSLIPYFLRSVANVHCSGVKVTGTASLAPARASFRSAPPAGSI